MKYIVYILLNILFMFFSCANNDNKQLDDIIQKEENEDDSKDDNNSQDEEHNEDSDKDDDTEESAEVDIQIMTEIYKKTPTRQLSLKIFKPKNIKQDERLPAIIFFFGGGWNNRNLSQFERYAERFSKKGMICFTADYRVFNTDSVQPDVCVMDAKSAMRYIYANAERLNVDKSKVIASGGSAGGHLAAATRYVDGFDDPSDDLKVNCQPTALVLFCPVVDNSKDGGYGYYKVKDFYPQISPAHNIKEPVPTIFFVGADDKYITPEKSKEYQQKCELLGGRCDLYIFDGVGHGLHNIDEYYEKTSLLTEEFLKSIGYL